MYKIKHNNSNNITFFTNAILGARENVYGVIVGGILGHSICTGLAVIGGRMIAQRISVRTGKFFAMKSNEQNVNFITSFQLH